jgi:hypothetical protein
VTWASDLFSSTGGEMVSDDRLFSPYAHDESIDNDALYYALCKRRQSHSLVPPSGPPACGELFSLILK